jgi:uncharacterized protein YeaO (DUF488 family)
MKIITIGLYGYDDASFFQALQEAGVDVFVDVRWRRGVRGAEYAFANSRRLQARLAELGIAYVHRRDLAPSPSLRARQHAADKQAKVAKRQRIGLDPAFVQAYQAELLSAFQPRSLWDDLPAGAQTVALFCVEREPAACHRSLLAAALAAEPGVEVKHLVP